MYYEEKVIDGQLCYRTTPDGPWAVVQYQELIRRLLAAEKRYRTFDQAREAIQGLLDIGKRDLTNPKYDGYFESLRNALAAMGGQP